MTLATPARRLRRKGSAGALVLVTLGLAFTCGVTSFRWVNTSFPGFFVMANRVIASISLPHWPVARHSHIYQHTIVAVNRQPVTTAESVYALVRRLPPGSAITYTVQKDGQTFQLTLPSVTFTLQDYCLLFGAYLVNGLAIALIGIGVWFLKPRAAVSVALLLVGLSASLFALTAADLYSPYWFFRLHVLGEAFFPAGLVHLALVFPVDRLTRYRTAVLAVPYLIACALGVAYEIWLYQPRAYSLIHNLCMVYLGLGGLALLGKVIGDSVTTDSPLVRQRIRIILVGFSSGYAFPAALMLFSGISGGEIPVNYAAFTAFLLPLSLGYAIVKHDLFEIDALLKRSVYYLMLTAVLTVTYLALLALLNFTVSTAAFTRSPLFPLIFTITVVLLLNPLKDRLQRGVDRVFFRLCYDPKKVLEVTSAALTSTLRLEEILPFIWQTIDETVGVRQGGIFLLSRPAGQYASVYPKPDQAPALATGHPLIEQLRRQGRVLSLYDSQDETSDPAGQGESRQALAEMRAQLLVPLIFKGDLIGFLALGPKESGTFFSADDIDFLHTLANQGALSIANALAYQEIHLLNTSLEQKVAQRTQALAHANTELQRSLQRLEQAYRDLEHSQEHLLRAEKMAALGRLAAGIAHEMNTPLGASLSSLKMLQDLIEEYKASIGDPEVGEGDHREIAAEMDKLVHFTRQWVEKTAAHIRSLKLHTRDLQRGEERMFSVLRVVEDTGLLLSHRLRLTQCVLSVSCNTPDPLLYGDPGKFGQVLTNLIANAIDAYKDLEGATKEVRVEISEAEDLLEIRVCDQGCGIPPEHLDKIFDEFFSTKSLGEGTGLGLAMARNIVTNFFGGTIAVRSSPGQGSEFLLQFPRTKKAESQESLSQPPVPVPAPSTPPAARAHSPTRAV
jgi:signal transduction histidine kinase